MITTSIIFGANGQDGYYLNKILLEKGHHVIGISRTGNWLKGNVADKQFVDQIIKEYKPQFIFHLAANSVISHETLFDNHEAISTGTLNILESVKNHSKHTKVFISGTGLQFQNQGLPINESTPFEASSAYSISRIHSVYAARYFRSLGLQVYIGYFFGHDSPLRTERHISGYIVSKAIQIRKGEINQFEVGDPSVKKEWLFAGDAVEAVWILLNQENIHEAIIGSGILHSISEWADYCFKYLDLEYSNYLISKNNYPSTYHVLNSDPSLMKSLGWSPKVSIKELAELMVHSKLV